MNDPLGPYREAMRRAASLYRRLDSAHAGVRLAARASLAELGADSVPLLLKLVSREKYFRLAARGIVALCLGIAFLLLLADMMKETTPSLASWVTGLTLAIPSPNLTRFQIGRLPCCAVRRAKTRRITRPFQVLSRAFAWDGSRRDGKPGQSGPRKKLYLPFPGGILTPPTRNDERDRRISSPESPPLDT